MYTQNGKNVRLATIEKRLSKMLTDHKIEFSPAELTDVSKQLLVINKLILSGKGVRALCVKEPPGNLDTGRHYFEIEYLDKKDFQVFWPAGNEKIAKFFGMIRQDRMRYLRRYLFTSGCIGMSRQLDATDTFFVRLKQLTGTYAQL